MTESSNSTRTVAVAMLRAGTATVAEIAELTKSSHQRVSYWAKAEGFDPRECRKLHLAKEWHRLLEPAPRKAPLPKRKGPRRN
jgi:hypothetical protein